MTSRARSENKTPDSGALCLSIVALAATMRLCLYNVCRKNSELTEARFKIKKLLQDLESQVSCSICFEFLRTPKTLPCFHAFSLQCLSKMAAHHAGDGEFKCPICRATTLIPQPEGTFDSCASSFLHMQSSARSAGHQRSS